MMRLLVTEKGQSRVVESPGPVVVIGRGTECSVHIGDEAASRKHCRIEQSADGSFTVADLSSRNGTRLNGEPIGTKPLKVGDVILIGNTAIAVQALGSAEHPSTAPTEALKPPAPEVPHPIRLDFLAGPNKGQSFAVTHKLTRIGRRRRDNDVALFDTGISNRHAEIRYGADGFEIADAGSHNGTFVNNQRVTRSPIKPGDRIQLGRCLLEVRAMDAAAEPAAQVPKPSPIELAPAEAEEPGTAEFAFEEAEGGGEPVSPASRRRVILLGTAIVLAAIFFTSVYVVRAIHRRSSTPTPAPVEPTEKAKEPAQPAKGGQPAETPKATTASPTAKGADAGGHTKTAAKGADADAAARDQLQAALDALRRAELTGEPEAFDAAERALDAAKAPLKGTEHERDLTQALDRLPAARQAAADRRLNAEAAALLAAAKQYSDRREPHIARLHCRELLARFPNSAAAPEAKALLQTLDTPPPTPKEK